MSVSSWKYARTDLHMFPRQSVAKSQSIKNERLLIEMWTSLAACLVVKGENRPSVRQVENAWRVRFQADVGSIISCDYHTRCRYANKVAGPSN